MNKRVEKALYQMMSENMAELYVKYLKAKANNEQGFMNFYKEKVETLMDALLVLDEGETNEFKAALKKAYPEFADFLNMRDKYGEGHGFQVDGVAEDAVEENVCLMTNPPKFVTESEHKNRCNGERKE